MTTATPRATRKRAPTRPFARALRAGSPAFFAALLAQSSAADASPGTSAEFRPSPSAHDGSGGLQLVHPFTGGKGSAYLGGFISVAEELDTPVSQRRLSAVHLGGAYTLADWLRFEADLPFVSALVEGDQTTAGLGDAQLSATIPFLSARPGGFGIGLQPFVIAPTQSETSGAAVQGGAALLIGGGDGNTGWRANLGGRSGDGSGAKVDLGLGGNWRFNPGFGVGVEVVSQRPVGPQTTEEAPAAPVEGSVYAFLGNDRRAATTVGFTTGFIPETGSPLYRVSLGLSWRKTGAPGDPDGDGIWGVLDDCPHTPEDRDDNLDGDGCPDPDDDHDGVPDVLDRCPADPEDIDGYSDRDGCPDPDNDFDGLIDTVDSCPDEAGPQDAGGCPDLDRDGVADKADECTSRPGRRESFGCPDLDADRVPDYRDLCPSQPVSPKVDPYRSNGCPSKAYLGSGRIELLDRVNFDFGSANIGADSFDLLRDVARILRENPSILEIEIGGHSDNVGSDSANLRLSRARAKAVRAFLIEQGIDADRLEAKGYGESRPVDSNATEAGRYQNRRVEFLVTRTAGPDPATGGR